VHIPLASCFRRARHRRVRRRLADGRGQTTAEYALVVLAAGTLALALILWARGSGSITDLFDQVIDHLTSEVLG
jgi:Flp pilus assembly pilin Flp